MINPLEADLIARVKEQRDSEALTQLINMHTGIYFTIASKYAHQYPNVIKIDDLSDDKMLNIYRFILDYKDDRGMQLSTYIGERTDYLCKDILKKEEKNPLCAKWCGGVDTTSFVRQDSNQLPYLSETYSVTDNQSVAVVASAVLTAPNEEANQTLAIDTILNVISANPTRIDNRFLPILKMKHLAEAPQSWRKIGRQLSLSHEQARKIYLKNMSIVKRCLKVAVV